MIKYRDYINKRFVTEQQAILLDFYEKIYYVDNEIKKIEIFMENVLKKVGYHLDPTEDLNAVLNNRENGVRWAIRSNKQISGDYLSWESRGYNENNEINFLSKTVARISTGFEVATIN